MKVEDFEAVVHLTCEAFGLPAYPVVSNNRFRSLLGRANYTRRIIEYRPAWLSEVDDREGTSVACHEVAHFVAMFKYGSRGHGSTFAYCNNEAHAFWGLRERCKFVRNGEKSYHLGVDNLSE